MFGLRVGSQIARRGLGLRAGARATRHLSTVPRAAGGSGSGRGSYSSSTPLAFLTAAAIGGASVAAWTQRDSLVAFAKGTVDYDAVRADIVAALENENYDDGSYGPVLIRLAWHASGTYDRVTGTGGSNGARMRFSPEKDWGANAGLAAARDLLEPIKAKHPGISYSDLWTLAGSVAIEEMGGPKINWKPGRSDAASAEGGAPDGRLPDASQGSNHVRDIFYRMGFSDREIVALVGGGHAIGRCHKDRSGYDGPWSFSPTTFSGEYFRLLVEEQWRPRKWDGPMQYEDVSTGTLMMLPADMVFITDPAFAVYTRMYAKDNDLFFRDFKAAWEKLITLGVPGQ